MKKTLVSVVVRTKDRIDLLQDAVESIALQTYRPIEVIIVNDAGTDVSIDFFSSSFPDVCFAYIEHCKNLGRSESINTGIEKANGEYIFFLDDDDLFYPNCVKTLLSNASEKCFSHAKGKCIHYDTKKIADQTSRFVLGEPITLGRLVLANYIPFNTVCFHRSMLKNIGPADKNLEIFEDWDLIIRAAKKYKSLFVNEIVSEYRIFNDATITGKGGNQKHFLYRKMILDKYINLISAEDILNFYQNSIDKVVLEKEKKISRYKEKFLESEKVKAIVKKEYSDAKSYINNLLLEIKRLENEIEKRDTWIHNLERTINSVYFQNQFTKKNSPVKENNMKEKIDSSFPHVKIMVLNYNGLAHIEKCLSSLEKTDYPNFSIQVIDNKSNDNSLIVIKTNFPSVELLEHNNNLGYGLAYDKAIKIYDGEFFVLLNNDTEVDPNWLNPLVGRICADDKLAAISPKLLFTDHPQIINHSGGGMNYIGIGYDIRIFEPDQETNLEPIRVLFPSGAACLMRKSAYLDAGGFDLNMFMYHEDVDLGWRLNILGYHIECLPHAKVYHAFGGSSLKEQGISFRDNLGYRHAIRSLIKNYTLPYLARSLPRLIILGLRARLRDGSIDFLRCMLWNLRHLHTTLLHRLRIQQRRKLSDDKLKPLIWQNISIPAFFPDYTIQTFDKLKDTDTLKETSIEIGSQEPSCLGYGWYGKERLNALSVNYRWTRSAAVLFLWSESSNSLIVLQMITLAATLGKQRQCDFFINGVEVASKIIDSDDVQYIELEHSGSSGLIELKIICRDTWTPHTIFNNQDHRTLGVGVIRASIFPSSSDQRPFNGISLIIPTYNRIDKLTKVIQALESQTLAKSKFEVIIVDDGSTDATEETIAQYAQHTKMNLKYLRQKNMKQGAARNNGLKTASMPLVAFIGDDIIPSANFLEEHLKRHNNQNYNGKLAVIGHTMWPDYIKVTPFMHFVHEYGYQFGFSIMEDGGNLPFNFFYTSNISLGKTMLANQKIFFDEDFGVYGWEDIELGFRLHQDGMRLCFEPRATAVHEHPVTIKDFCRRQIDVGISSKVFLEKHPQLRNFLNDNNIEKWAKLHLLAKISAFIIDVFDQKHIKMPHKIYKFILHTYYCTGIFSENEKRSKS